MDLLLLGISFLTETGDLDSLLNEVVLELLNLALVLPLLLLEPLLGLVSCKSKLLLLLLTLLQICEYLLSLATLIQLKRFRLLL